MTGYIWICMLISAVVTFAIRVLPVTLIRKPIKNTFIRSFLYYVPYATLAVMTFPAIIDVTHSPAAGLVALAAGIIAAAMGAGLFPVAAICCVIVAIAKILPLV